MKLLRWSVLAAALAASAPAFAQDQGPVATQPDSAVVDRVLQRLGSGRLAGWPREATFRGQQAQGNSASEALKLTPGVLYVVAATCDQGCTNLDIRIIDSAGNVAAEDVGPDSFPVLSFTAAEAEYGVLISVRNCTQPTCAYGMDVFRRP